jgi:hypothetical protein
MLEAGISHIPVFCADIDPLRALGGGDATYFGPDDSPSRVAALVTERMASEATYRVASRVRANFTWSGIYRQHIAPLLHTP